jgi:L-asparaginase II
MGNPVLVEVTRGVLTESRHQGAVCVADSAGKAVIAIGDVATSIFPRSAVKVMQALVLVESGAADRYRFGDAELALACASHSGEPDHVAGVERMLARAGLDVDALQCGTHWPTHRPSADALIRAGLPASPLHHNCSGKHAGFLCAACATGSDPRTYTASNHAVQREVHAILENLAGSKIDDKSVAIDGCSVPTFALSLAGLARAFAVLGSEKGLEPERAAACRRLRAACAAKPWYVAGSGSFATEIMSHFGPRVFVKGGAEGVYGGALPDHQMRRWGSPRRRGDHGERSHAADRRAWATGQICSSTGAQLARDGGGRDTTGGGTAGSAIGLCGCRCRDHDGLGATHQLIDRG